ncbi:extracellular solute-binding protein [uncultured Enterovirga sp.]|uniref:extracellular solute-binding protein n=1 Tax=uncultured Enterovirga sp. TaxID=2026352 RepID=UPI0035CC0D92
MRNGVWIVRTMPAALGATLLLGLGAAVAADLTVGAFGGIWEQSLRKCVVEPFQKRTGKTVDVVLGAPVQWLNQIAATPTKPPLDVFYLPSENAYDAIDRGLVEAMPPEKVPNLGDVREQFRQLGTGFGTPHNYGGMGIIYNKTTVKDPPKDWKAFVEGTIAGKWKASMPTVTYPSGGLTASVWSFAKEYGGGVNNIAPGLEQIKKMQKSGNIAFWFDPNSVLNGLKSGDIDLAMYWDGRAWAFIDDGNKDFDYLSPKPGVVVGVTWVQMVKNGSPLAYDYINQTLSKESQSCFGSAIRYGIVNKNATFDPKIAHEITDPSLIIFPPYKEIVPMQSKWVETWNKEIGR